MLLSTTSGTRGTIGGNPGENLTPQDLVGFISAYGMWLKTNYAENISVVIGRDARVSGSMLVKLAIGTLQGLGIHVIDLGMVPTPTVGISTRYHKAQGGIIITASHNPKEYNGIKMLNAHGEFLNAENGQDILTIMQNANYNYCDVDNLGSSTVDTEAIHRHIQQILGFDIVNKEKIKERQFKVVVDGINSVGGIAVPELLKELGVECVELYCEANGQFAHIPEPLEQNLTDLKEAVVEHKADLGISVDPDADRLVLVSGTGDMLGEEYTIVAAADYVLSKTPGNVVSNLSSSRALSDIAKKYTVEYSISKVGEISVVEKMKETNAVIGGEGNGGVIYPPHHYGRDAMIGIALILSHLAETGMTASELRASYPNYFMAKEKIALGNQEQIATILETIKKEYASENITTIDGVKIDFVDSWVHVRASNTEPIIRIFSEATSQTEADSLVNEIINKIKATI